MVCVSSFRVPERDTPRLPEPSSDAWLRFIRRDPSPLDSMAVHLQKGVIDLICQQQAVLEISLADKGAVVNIASGTSSCAHQHGRQKGRAQPYLMYPELNEAIKEPIGRTPKPSPGDRTWRQENAANLAQCQGHTVGARCKERAQARMIHRHHLDAASLALAIP